MPKRKSRKTVESSGDSTKQSIFPEQAPIETATAPIDDFELESFEEPAWLANCPPIEDDSGLEAPAWLETTSSSQPALPLVEIEEPEDSLFLAADAMADLATMGNAVLQADVPSSGEAAIAEQDSHPAFDDDFPDAPAWAASPAEEPLPQHSDAPAPALQADAALRSIIDEIDTEVASTAKHRIADPGTPARREARLDNATAQHVVFYLGRTRYSLPIESVTEVTTVPRITALPGIPHYVRGVANLRGEILPVLDMRGLLGLTPASNAVLERMLVVSFAEQDAMIGFVVDRVRGLTRLDPARIAQPQGLAEDAVLRFLDGVGEHEDEVLNVLNTRKIFHSEEVRRLSGN